MRAEGRGAGAGVVFEMAVPARSSNTRPARAQVEFGRNCRGSPAYPGQPQRPARAEGDDRRLARDVPSWRASRACSCRSVPAAAGLFPAAEFGRDLRAVCVTRAGRKFWLPGTACRAALRLRGDARAIASVCTAKKAVGEPLAFGVLEASRLVWLQVTAARLGHSREAWRGPAAL